MADNKELNLENADQKVDEALNADNTEIADAELDQVTGGKKHKYTIKKGSTSIQIVI